MMNDPSEALERLIFSFLGLKYRGPFWRSEEKPEFIELQEQYQPSIVMLTKTGRLIVIVRPWKILQQLIH